VTTVKNISLAASIEHWLVTKIADLSGLAPEDIDICQPFANYGLNSAEAVVLAGDLGDMLGVSLSATLAWDYPTISLLSEKLAEHLGASADLRAHALIAMTEATQ
jgi:acyl carrier protein